MESVQLIANSGIQFYKFDIEIDPFGTDDVIKSIGFYEWADSQNSKVVLEYAKYLSNERIWVSKRQLGEEGFLDENGDVVTANLNLELLKELKFGLEVFSVNDIETPLEFFEGKWLPLPYFESTSSGHTRMGPINWCRMKLVPQNTQRKKKSYKVVLAFDTSVSGDYEDNEGPQVLENHKTFKLCSDLEQLLNFTNEKYGCGWVENYLADLVHGGRKKVPNDFPSMKYIGYFIYLVKYLREMGGFPMIDLYANLPLQSINVDLVLDIGNSNTCGILFESPQGKDRFEFTAVKKLKIQDLSAPEQDYDDPFSMRLAFHKCDFGEMVDQDKKFQWPSFVRVGAEAKRLIYQSTNKISTDSRDQVTNHSSPKRYLWDDEPSQYQWELTRIGDQSGGKTFIWVEGISQQFTQDGSFTRSVDTTTTNNFSRRSLMTMVFIEILAHAMVQINSHEFRSKHGNSTMARRLRRLVVTCPTAMVQAEQVVLRQCAEEASIALSRFYSKTYRQDYDEKNDRSKVEIIPSIKDLEMDLGQSEHKVDWIYDEATCCQLVFLYAEISKRYQNDCDKYFNIYGRKRPYLHNYDKNSITVGSIDIGGGTTDLMICTYKYTVSGGGAVLTPIPVYWESFNYAGDDLLKQIVRQVIIEGDIKDEEFRGCTGVIENYARERQVGQVEIRLNNFFGKDTNAIDFIGQQIRRKFNTQISVPIAERYLAHAKEGGSDTILTYDDLFPELRPNQEVLDYFERHFGFKFQDIRWKMSAKRINDIIETAFEPMIKQLSALLHVKGCDFVLLAGRPTSLEKVSDLFLKFYPVSPDRIITLNEYRVGRWYPFQDGNGYFTDQKSLVAVGASIALMGGKLDKLKGFRLNTERLMKDLISTAEYFGHYDSHLHNLKNVFIAPDQNKNVFETDSFPVTLGFKRLPTNAYPSRVIYQIEFDDKIIMGELKKKFKSLGEDELMLETERYKTDLASQHSFRISVSREYRNNRERLTLEYIQNKSREDIKSFFKFRLKTLDEEKGYWLDTGEFELKIKPK